MYKVRTDVLHSHFMKKKPRSKKIVDNPSSKKLLNPIKGMNHLITLQKFLPKVFHFLPNLDKHTDELKALEEQVNDLLYLPDRFNDLFAEHGWIASESMSVEIMKSAIALAEKQGISDAEVLLTEYYHDKNTLDFLFIRIRWYEVFTNRMRLLDLAREDYEAKRYHACIPLLLSLIDGIVNDLSQHVGLFAENSDVTVWDSIVGHETGLQYISGIFKQPRKKTNEEIITIPFRNGILHGRELAFDNPIVAAKCWATLLAVRDWIDSIKKVKTLPKDEEEKSFSEVLSQLAENQQRKQRFEKLFEEWQPRNADTMYNLPINSDFTDHLIEGSPEATIFQFILDWKYSRYGKLVPVLHGASVDIKRKVLQTKQDYEKIRPLSFAIISIEDETPAISNIGVDLMYEYDNSTYNKKIIMRTVYEDNERHPLIRSEFGGSWNIIQLSYSDLLYGLHK